MKSWKKCTASALAFAAGAALWSAPSSAQSLSRMSMSGSAESVHAQAVADAHRASIAARSGHPKLSAQYAARAQREYNQAYRMRMNRSR